MTKSAILSRSGVCENTNMVGDVRFDVVIDDVAAVWRGVVQIRKMWLE